MLGQTTDVVGSMSCLQGCKPDLTPAEEYWVGNVGPGYEKPRKSGRRTWTLIGHPFYSHPLVDMRRSQEYGPE